MCSDTAEDLGGGFGFCDLGCKTYAIPTCYRIWVGEHGRVTRAFENVNQIKPFVDSFISDAEHYKQYTFYVTKIGCGIAGFKISEVAELFRPCLGMENVILVSGQSVSTFKTVLSNIEGNAEDVMMNVLNSERYGSVVL